MTAPERILAWRWDLPYPSRHQGRREWGDLLMPTEQKVAEYVRTDLHDATKAQLAKAVEALRKIAASEVEVWDEDLGENVMQWLDDEEMADTARAVLAEITGEKS